jgi:hypothetical protein
VLALIAAGALAAISLWWQETPPIHGLGDWLTNAGRITGLAAGYGVVVLVALMARLPPEVMPVLSASKLSQRLAYVGQKLLAAHDIEGLFQALQVL